MKLNGPQQLSNDSPKQLVTKLAIDSLSTGLSTEFQFSFLQGEALAQDQEVITENKPRILMPWQQMLAEAKYKVNRSFWTTLQIYASMLLATEGNTIGFLQCLQSQKQFSLTSLPKTFQLFCKHIFSLLSFFPGKYLEKFLFSERLTVMIS